MVILVTGAAGFIGSSLVDKLLSLDHCVIGVDDFNDFYDPKIKWSNLSQARSHRHFRLFQSDIRKTNLFETIFKKESIDCVVHLAARAGVRPSLADPQLYYDVNVMGSLKLLEAMRLHHVPQLVFASSSSVYGNRTDGPFKESDNTDHQVSPYGATKKALEGLASTYAHLYGIATTGLRFFTVYGPRNRPSMACSLFLEALIKDEPIMQFGDGKSGRDYTYIDDIVEGIVGSINRPLKYEIINLGNHTPVELKQLISLTEKVTGKRAKVEVKPFQAGDVQFTYADITKAKKLLKWQPRTELRDGLANLYQSMIIQNKTSD